MPNSTHGKFVWYDLMTTDVAAAQSFYGAVMGWAAQDADMSDNGYVMFSTEQSPVAGLMVLPAEALERGARPGWNGYIAVNDVDANARGVVQAGGAVHRQPDDIPGVGRFAVVADPQGAVFILFKGMPDQQSTPPAVGTPGYVGWHELSTNGWERTFDFYSTLFGWTKADAVDMGAMGLYQTFTTGDVPVGGMMNKTDATAAAPAWMYYFNVSDIDAALDRVKQHGGQVLNGPHPVPGGSWILHCLDPQGATFAMAGPKAPLASRSTAL